MSNTSKGLLSQSSLPLHPTLPSNNSQPAALHLYPHIHGHGHPPPILPKLYELHNSSQVDLLANFSHLSKRNDLLHYSDWDNSSSVNHHYSDLLGANHIPPLLTSNPFVTDPMPDITPEDTSAFFRGSQGISIPSCMAQMHSNIEHIHTDTCFKNKTTHSAQLADVSLSSSMPHLSPGCTSSKASYLAHQVHSSMSSAHQTTLTQHQTTNTRVTTNDRTFSATTCSKDNHTSYNLSPHKYNVTAPKGLSSTTATATQPQTTRPASKSTTPQTTTRARMATPLYNNRTDKHTPSCQGRGLVESNDQLASSCTSDHKVSEDEHNICASGNSSSTTGSNSSGGCCNGNNMKDGLLPGVGGCEKHHHHDKHGSPDEESCDMDDGSDPNSVNGTQKDSKYCDCCYCEFFGHSGVGFLLGS